MSEATPLLPQRNYHEVRWDTLWARDGGDGSKFGRPVFVAADSSSVAVFDSFGQRLFVFSPNGVHQHLIDRVPGTDWPFRRVLDLKRTPTGGYVIVDSEARRLITIGNDLAINAIVSLAAPAHYGQVVATDSMIGILAHAETATLDVMDRTGELIQTITLFRADNTNPSAGHAQLSAPDSSGRFVVTFSYRNAWLLMQLDRVLAEGRYLHGLASEELEQGPSSRQERRVGAVANSRSSFIVGDEVHVLAAGNGIERLRVIDAYRHSDGAYIGSYHAPAVLVHLSAVDSIVYVIAAGGSPTVMALVPRCVDATLILDAGLAAC